VVMLLLARPLLGRPPGQSVLVARAVQAVIALAFVAVAVWSSFLALRSAHVGPGSHAEQLAELRSLLKGGRTLFLSPDSFAGWHLRGVPLAMPGGAAAGTRHLSTRMEKRWSPGIPLDFDSVPARELDAAAYVVTSRTRYASEPPPNFRLVRSTRSYQLWRRLGRTPRRLILNEGSSPGAVLDCRTEAGRLLRQRAGWARVWPLPLRAPVPEAHTGVGLGAERSLRLDLGTGQWELSLQYQSPQRLTVAGSSIRGSLPASRDWPGPFWEIGEVTDEGSEPTSLTITVTNPTHFSPRRQVALLGDVAAVRIDAKPRLLPLSRTCGKYVDWFTLGPRRPDASP
jgi:hypothetical protein